MERAGTPLQGVASGPASDESRPERALPAMEVRDVHFAYGRNKILKGVSLSIERGKVTTILGSNGCGKSTLFNLMTKNLEPNRGKVFLRGRNIANVGLKEFAKRVSIVHQYNDAAADITVEKLVYMGRTPHLKAMSEPGEDDMRIVEWAIEVTNIGEYRDREVSRLSGGQRQRVWIAMALAQNTKVLFLDEPTTYLDIRYQIETLDLVRKLNRDFGITIVMVLHDINQAIYYSDRIIGLADGRVAVQGAPADVVTAESIRELFGIDLAVTEMNGKKYVLLRDDQAVPGAEAMNASALAGEAAPAAEPPAAAVPAGGAPGGGPAEDGAGEPAPDAREQLPSALRRASAATVAAMRRNGTLPPEYDEVMGGAVQPQHDAAAAREPLVPPAGRKKERRQSNSRLARVLWTLLGVVAFALGTVGTVLPFLPTVPLYLLALFCFAKGSRKLHDWFVGTKLYHRHLESFVDHRGMTWRSKLSIMGTVTVVMAIAFLLMSRVPVARIVLLAVWIVHIIVFLFVIKTDKAQDEDVQEDSEPA